MLSLIQCNVLCDGMVCTVVYPEPVYGLESFKER